MIIFFYGSDGYRLKQNKERVIESHWKKYSSGVNLLAFDFSENSSLATLEEAVKSTSFFNEQKLLVIENICSQKASADRLEELIKQYNLETLKDISLLVIEYISEKDLRAKQKGLFGLLTGRNSIVKTFELLSGINLEKWIRQECELRSCAIEPVALKKLVNEVGNESWRLINEIEKLANYKGGGVITGEDVDLLVSPKIDLNIFDLIDALAVRNKNQTLELLYKELKNGRDPYYLLTMITYQFRNLLIVKDLADRGLSQADIAKKAGIHPFVVRKTLPCLAEFSLNDLKSIYYQLLVFDTSAKMGKTDLVSSLYSFVLD